MNALLGPSQNRYLVDARGSDLSTRLASTVRAFGFIAIVAVLCVLVGVFSDIPVVAVPLGLLAGATFIAWPIFMWIRILRGGKLIEEATLAWHHANALPGAPGAELALPAAHYVLREVFRSDFRVRGFHLLGLVAEQEGAFREAIDLFTRAESALPSMASPQRKQDVRVYTSAHRAIAWIALGNVGAARAEVERASRALGTTPGGLFAAFDDSSWGLGAASLNEVLLKMEARRPPRAVLGLAWALVHLAEGNTPLVLQLYQGEYAVLEQGLLPRERALLERTRGLALAALGPGPHRSPGVPATAGDRWADAVRSPIARI